MTPPLDEKTTEPSTPASITERYARAGYEGRVRFLGGKTSDGRALPAYDDLDPHDKNSWAAAAFAVLVAYKGAGKGPVVLTVVCEVGAGCSRESSAGEEGDH